MPSTDIKDYWRRSWGIGDRVPFDAGGMAKVVEYVESLPKGTTVTKEMIEGFVSKNKLNINIANFFNRKAPNIKDKKFDNTRKFYSTNRLKKGSNPKSSSVAIGKYLENLKSGSTVNVADYISKNNITTTNSKTTTGINFKRLLKKFPEKNFKVITAEDVYKEKGFNTKPLTQEQTKVAKEVYKAEIKNYDSFEDWRKDSKNSQKVSNVRVGKTTLETKASGLSRFDTDRIVVRKEGKPDFPDQATKTKFEKDIKLKFTKPQGQGIQTKDFAKKYPVTKKQMPRIMEYYVKKDNLKYPKADPSKTMKSYLTKKERYGAVTDLTVEEQLSKEIKKPFLKDKGLTIQSGKTQRGVIDFAHRISKDHANALGIQFGTQNTGFDSRLINEVIVKPSEIRLDNFYKRQRNVLDIIKLNGVNKELAEEMNTLNKLINKEVKKTSGRLIGVNIDPYTQEISFSGKNKNFKLANLNKSFKELKEIPAQDRIKLLRKEVARSIDAEIKRGFRPSDFKEILGDSKNRATLLNYAKRHAPDILSKFKNILNNPSSTKRVALYSKFALGEGFILDDVLKKQAEGKSALESFGSALFLDKPIHKGLKRWKATQEQNLAYDRANLLKRYENSKDAGSVERSTLMSSVVSAATQDSDFKGQPGEYIEWLKMVVADPHQQRLIRERDIETEEALTLPPEKVAKRKKRYEAWKSIPAVQAVEEYITSDKQKEKVEVKDEWLNRGGLTGVDQYIINRHR